MAFKPAYYFTEMDPDYHIKGARDPLGLQVLWQDQAHKIIPYLSTVSNNLNDFHILGLAHFLYGKEPDRQFANYFLRFEQLMAYVRCSYGIDENFNGVRRVKMILMDDERKRINISNKPSSAILSDQRTYGIWGKYNRPFTDMDILRHPDFNRIMQARVEKVSKNPNFGNLLSLLQKPEGFTIRIDDLEYVVPLFEYNKADRIFYEDLILKCRSVRNYQGELLEFLHSGEADTDLAFYPFLNAFKQSRFAQSEDLQHTLTETEATERILAPVNRVFRYLQGKPLWTKQEIEKDAFIKHCREIPVYLFSDHLPHNKTKNEMGATLLKDNWSLVLYLVKRNKEVTSWRGGGPWISQNNEVVEVHLGDSGYSDTDFDPMQHNDNDYFFGSFINLFEQIHEK